MMMKIAQMIECIKEDVNNEDSMTLTLFNRALQTGYWLILLSGIPLIVHLLISFGKLL